MTRHSPSEAVGGEIPVPGLHANFTLLSAFNDAVGKEVLLELSDGTVFSGIFGGASSEMEVGLYCAYERKAENEKNLLPLKSDIVQKRQFAFADIVCVTVPTNDEKQIRGFATDRDYHNKRRTLDDEGGELEAWEGDGEDVDLESEEAVKAARQTATARNGGWGVNEMFAANQSLGVKTTFEDNLSQYTTAEVEGTDEDRRRADEIARQIEKSGSSRMYSALENDDEERDLDKQTEEAELFGADPRNKNYSNGISSTTTSSVTPSNGQNGTHNNNNSSKESSSGHHYQNGTSPRPQPLMNTTPPGFTPVTNGHRKKQQNGNTNDHSSVSQNTYLSLSNRGGMNNNGRGGMTPKNNRAEGLKDTRRSLPAGGPPSSQMRGGPPITSPKGGGGGYQKRDGYEGQGHMETWQNPPKTSGPSGGGVKTYENSKMRENQKTMLENRNTQNSPRNGPGGQPAATPQGQNQGQKTGVTGRMEGLKAWQNDFNYRETRPQNEKKEGQPTPTPLLDAPPAPPPTKNAWQSGPPSGLTSSSSKSDESSGSKGAASAVSPLAPPSAVDAPTPAEMMKRTNEERGGGEEAGASTSREDEQKNDENGAEKKEDADVSKDSAGKKFSFNPDAPAFTPKFGSGGGGPGGPSMMVGPGGPMGGGGGQPPLMMQSAVVPMVTNIIPTQGMPMQGQMGGMGGMPQPTMVYSYPAQPHYAMQQQNMQYSAVVNGGSIMAGTAQNGGGLVGGGGTPRGGNGGVMGGGGGPRGGGGGAGGAGGGPRGQGIGGGPNGGVPVTMTGNAMYMTPVPAYQATSMPQQTYMQHQPNYYQYPVQPQMMQGTYMPMQMQQQGMMGQPQRGYVPAPAPQGMMMYGGQQQYGPPPGVNQGGPGGPGGPPQMGGGGGPQGGQGGGGVAPSVSSTNGGQGGGGGPNGGGMPLMPPSQPPTPGAGQTQGGGPNQGGVGGGPQQGMVPVPVPSPGMYAYGGGAGGPQGMVYYNQGGGQQMGGGGGPPMNGGEGMGGEGGGPTEGGSMHNMQQQQHYPQYQGGNQYYQNAPPHLMRQYNTMPQHMQQQQQPQHPSVQPSQSQN